MNPVESSGAARFIELDAEYEIIGELGRGGTAIVYRARERELGRDVAIKVVRSSHLDDTEAVARLAREARLVAAMRHPNVVPLLGIKHLSDGLALIMQHVPGRTLKRAIREDGPLPIGLVEHVLREIASALDYAHKRHGIVHRDIKPENIYLDEEVGRAVLSDFGIARTSEGESTLTLVGTALGTPAYMSPEQIDGTTLDGRSDLYSLGLVAYEMLSGQQPWAGHNLYTIIYKQKHEELPPLGSFRRDVPLYLQHAVDSLLRKDVAARCADAAQFIAQLPGTATTPPSFAPNVREETPVQPAVSDDSPTVRYQRPAVVEANVITPPPFALPVEPDLVLEPAIAAVADVPIQPAQPEPISGAAALAAVAEVMAEPAEPPVLELPTVRPNWRRAISRRGTLGSNAVYAQPEVAAAETVEVMVAAASPDRRQRNARLVAGLTLFLVLGGSATVVAMMNGREKAPEVTALKPTVDRNPATPGLVKASGPVSPQIVTAGNSTTPQPNPSATNPNRAAQTQLDSTRRAEVRPLPVPTVSVPDIALSTAGRQMTAGDFSSAGVMPTAGDESVTSTPSFTPRTVEPQLRNRTAVQKALAENYPRVLRERHIGGTVRLWVLIDSVGRVIRSELHQTSGNDFLDKAAIKVADVMQFTPAMNRDRKVSVWVLLPINFKTQQ